MAEKLLSASLPAYPDRRCWYDGSDYRGAPRING